MDVVHTVNAVQDWLESLQVKATLEPDEHKEALTLLGDPRLGSIISLLMGSKQAALVQLANLPLDSNSAVARASVLQGQTKGIELLRSTLVELVTPVEAAAPSEGGN